MMIQQVIQGKVCDIHTRIIISPTNRTFNKPMKHKPSKSSSNKNITDSYNDNINDINIDFYCGECAEDDLKR